MSIVLTREQVRRVDQLAVEHYGISGLVLMENAGRNAASIIDDQYGPAGKVLICCGPGNNGGDGCVIARHLHNTAWQVRLMLAGDPSRLTHDTSVNYSIVEAMGLRPMVAPEGDAQRSIAESISQDEVVVDALLGTGFRGEVRSPTDELIHGMNASDNRAVVAIDVPSGLDCDSGRPSNATIRADLTITFVASKVGFEVETAGSYVGRTIVADIGAPRELIEHILSGKA
jgi:NAD(P)H-hydrate epimerase